MSGSTMLSVITTIINVGFVLTSLISFDSYMSKESNGEKPWYDILNYYYTFFESHVPKINELLAKTSCDKYINAHNKTIPAVGKYTYQFKDPSSTDMLKITLTKVKTKNNFGDSFIYQACSSNYDTLQKFKEYVEIQERDEVTVISIDTSNNPPGLVLLSKRCNSPKISQNKILDIIHSTWIQKQYDSLKVLVVGRSGVGKTYLGRLLKKRIEETEKSMNVMLYDDFNPSAIGVNVNTMILNQATRGTPVVVMINEIDRIFNKVLEPSDQFDPRLVHTKNECEFHNMLDNIDDKKYVVALYTSEILNIEEIESYKSFMRLGRVDMIIELMDDDVKIIRGI